MTLPVLPNTLKGDLRGKSFSHEASARIACCLAFMPDFWWGACLVVVSCDMAGKTSC